MMLIQSKSEADVSPLTKRVPLDTAQSLMSPLNPEAP
jgi:hypothetical protein